ncbi:MAG: molybdopterin-containing oxidoreductase family protein [Actinomycetota bacterium]
MSVREIVLTTCPRDCYDACGIQVIKRDGVIEHVRGDPAHPVARGKLCKKCAIGYNGVWRDPAARIQTPLRRTGPKGSGAFESVTWDEALRVVAENLGRVRDTQGAQAILSAHYSGTLSLLAYQFPSRLFDHLGATEVDPDSVCNKAGHVALDYVYGTSLVGFDPRSARDARCIVVWGANPSTSAPHVDEHWLAEAPGTVVIVDPIRTPTAARADIHLQLFPGSDGALAFALLHVLLRDGYIDLDFVHRHTIGWAELEALVGPCTPAWGERVTNVPAALIEQAARAYGEGPSLLWLGQGFQRQRFGGNAMRAAATLPAVTGNVGKAGAGFLYLQGGERRGIDDAAVAGDLARVPRPMISQMDLASALEDPRRSGAFVCWNINVAASSPEQARLRRSLIREDLFTVVVDLFPTDTTELADIVLPAASFLEFDDLVLSYFDLTISAQVKAAEPMGDSLPNPEIFRRLAHAMGLTEPKLFEPDRDIIDHVLAGAGLGVSFEELAARGTVPFGDEPIVQFPDLVFPTPSGRIEIASAQAERDGHTRVPQPTAEDRPAPGRFRLLSPASPWLMNDSFANDDRIERKLGPAWVAMHPEDAEELSLVEGDVVELSNEIGRIQMRLRLSDEVLRGVVLSPKGRWPKREPAGANVNVLNGGEKADMGGSTAVHSIEVAVALAR